MAGRPSWWESFPQRSYTACQLTVSTQLLPPRHLPLQARGGLCTSAATRPGEPCWPLWFSSSLPTPLEIGPLVKLFSGTLTGVPILGDTQALGTTVTVTCWSYPIISAHASLPVVHGGRLLASLHPSSFLVLENFPLGEGPSSHHGSHKGKYSFPLPHGSRAWAHNLSLARWIPAEGLLNFSKEGRPKSL